MILIDTNVILDFWKNPTDELKNIFLSEGIAICGIVKAELKHGAKSDNDLLIIERAFMDFVYLPFDDKMWEKVGNLLYKCRRNGITVPFQDAILSCIAIKYDCLLWTLDKHFILIQSVAEKIKFFHSM